jgi:hypothetical protein
MKSKLADELREEHRAFERALSPAERVALAERLGDEAVAAYASAHGVSRDEAIAVFTRNRQRGRRPSRCAGGS